MLQRSRRNFDPSFWFRHRASVFYEFNRLLVMVIPRAISKVNARQPYNEKRKVACFPLIGRIKMSRFMLLALVVTLGLSGCVPLLAGSAGGLIVDEGMVETDGVFDPLENTAVGRRIYD